MRNMKKAYFLKLKSVHDLADINSLPHAALGRPLPVRGELDADIAEYVPLMLAKLALRYQSLTFVVAKIIVYCYACALVCHVVSKVENGVLPVQLVAERKTVVPFAAKL